MIEFTKNDWDHMHDCILDATWKTTKKNCSQEELEEIYETLPIDLKLEAELWGMNDTVWRDNFIEWYLKNN
jgi:hypothetical protein